MIGTYDPKKVLLIINGLPVNGFAENEMIKIDYKEDQYTTHTGADGNDSCFVRNNDESATIMFTLMETSLSNLTLKALMLTGLALSISMVNLGTGKAFFAAQCRPGKKPSVNWNKDVPTQEYTFVTPKIIG